MVNEYDLRDVLVVLTVITILFGVYVFYADAGSRENNNLLSAEDLASRNAIKEELLFLKQGDIIELRDRLFLVKMNLMEDDVEPEKVQVLELILDSLDGFPQGRVIIYPDQVTNIYHLGEPEWDKAVKRFVLQDLPVQLYSPLQQPK